MDAFDQRYAEPEELQRDGNSVLFRAIDREDGVTWLVRRLVASHRGETANRAGFLAEAEYSRTLDCVRCPEAEAITLDDGELVLEYRGGPGVELDRVLSALEASGRVLEPAAAVALVSEVLHNAETIGLTRPPAVTGETWGHGEISPRTVILGRDGFGRLCETRLVTSGFRALASAESELCLAPELAGGAMFGTPAGDVYAVGAILVRTLLGAGVFETTGSEPLEAAVARRIHGEPGVVPSRLSEVLIRAVATDPAQRYPYPAALRDALRRAVPLDLNGWRATAEGLAELARTLGSDRRLARVPDVVFQTYSNLARPHGARRPSLDEALMSFATEKALSSSEIAEALSPLATSDLQPKPLPRRISVVPRRAVSQTRSWPPPEAIASEVPAPHMAVSERATMEAAAKAAASSQLTMTPVSEQPIIRASKAPPVTPPPRPPIATRGPLSPVPAKPRPQLEIIPSDPPRQRPVLEIIPSLPTAPEPTPPWLLFVLLAATAGLIVLMLIAESRP